MPRLRYHAGPLLQMQRHLHCLCRVLLPWLQWTCCIKQRWPIHGTPSSELGCQLCNGIDQSVRYLCPILQFMQDLTAHVLPSLKRWIFWKSCSVSLPTCASIHRRSSLSNAALACEVR